MFFAEGGYVFAERIFVVLRRKCHFCVWHGCVVLRHAYIIQIIGARCARKACEIRIAECARYLACAVRAEVENDYGVMAFYRAGRPAVAVEYYCRNDEFVIFAARVRRAESFEG